MSPRRPMRRRLALAGLVLALFAGAVRAESVNGPSAASEGASGAESVGAPGTARRGLEGAPASFRSWIESLPEGQQPQALRRLADMPTQRRHRLFQRWDALDEGQRRVFEQRMLERLEHPGPLQERLQRMSPESREKLAPLVRRWHDMGPAERHRMRRRLERFRMLAPEDQQALIDRKFEAKSPEERARILEALREASNALPPRPLLDADPGTSEPAPKE